MSPGHPELWQWFDYLDVIDFGETPQDAAAFANAASHLKTCERCVAEVESLRAMFHDLADTSVFDEAATSPPSALERHIEDARAFAAELEADDAFGLETVRLLEERPLAEWEMYLRAHVERQTAGLIRQLLQYARTLYERDPQQALEVLDITLPLAERLGDDGRAVTYRAWTHKERANAFRFLSKYEVALEELGQAEALYRQLPVHMFDLAFVEWSRATVLFYQTRYADALERARSAIHIFQQHGSIDYVEQVRVLEAGILYEQGDIKTARTSWTRSAEIFADDPAMLARLMGNIAECEMRLGNYAAAERHAAAAIAMHERHGNDAERTRTEWIVAHCAVRQGNVVSAKPLLAGLHRRFQRLGMKLEAAQVRLDLVNVQLQQRDWQAAALESAELVSEFAAIGAAVHQADALAYLHEAVRNQSATPALVEYVRDYVRIQNAETFVPPRAN